MSASVGLMVFAMGAMVILLGKVLGGLVGASSRNAPAIKRNATAIHTSLRAKLSTKQITTVYIASATAMLFFLYVVILTVIGIAGSIGNTITTAHYPSDASDHIDSGPPDHIDQEAQTATNMASSSHQDDAPDSNGTPPTDEREPSILFSPTGSVVLAVRKSTLVEWQRAVKEENQEKTNAFSSILYHLESGTRVEVLESDGVVSQVKILEGKSRGRVLHALASSLPSTN